MTEPKLDRITADAIWEKHKEQYPQYSIIPKDTSTQARFGASFYPLLNRSVLVLGS